MSAPQRWADDPDAEEVLRDVVRSAARARPLDQLTRRRLGARVVRASAIPVAAAGWLFMKTAAAALAVVLGGGALAATAGLVPSLSKQPAANVSLDSAKRLARPKVRGTAPQPMASSAPPPIEQEEEAEEARERPLLNPVPSLPLVPPGGPLSAETALLERARRAVGSAPALALSLASEHATRFPRGQLTAERQLLQIDALHRLGRDTEARALAQALLGGANVGLYAERVHQLLGERAQP